MQYRSFLSVLSLAFAGSSSMATAAEQQQQQPQTARNTKNAHSQYRFDVDASGQEECQRARKEQPDDEEFRLFCINKLRSFKQCAIECSDALTMEGTTAACKSHRCDFYGFQFEDVHGKTLSMSKMAQGKSTMVAILPMYEAHVQYFYEMFEELRSMYQDTTEIMILPLEVFDWDHEYEKAVFEYTKEKRVHVLPEIEPKDLGKHAFFRFIKSLSPETGNPTMDILTDRPVIFVVSPDGNAVERFVTPTLAQLEGFVQQNGGRKTSLGNEHSTKEF